MNDPVREFTDAMAAEGLAPPREVIADGRIQRFKPVGDKSSSLPGWYCLHLDGVPAGAFGSWKTGETYTWSAKRVNELTPQERAELKRRIETDRRAREREQIKVQEAARARCTELWA